MSHAISKKLFLFVSGTVVLSYRYLRFPVLMMHLSPSLPAHRAGYLFYGGQFELFYAVIWYLVWDREMLGNHILGTLSDAPRVFKLSRPSP